MMPEEKAETLFWTLIVLAGLILIGFAVHSCSRTQLAADIATGKVRVESHAFGDGTTVVRIVRIPGDPQ